MVAQRRRFGSALLLVVVLCFVVGWMRRTKPAQTVEVTRVERGTVRELVPAAASGIVEPVRRVLVRSELSGQVAGIERPRGSRVAAGDPVLRFDTRELTLKQRQAAASLGAAQAARALAEARAQAAARLVARSERLAESGSISPAELDRQRAEAEVLRQAVREASAGCAQAEAQVDWAALQVARAVVRAPFAGVIAEVAVEVGSQSTPTLPLFDLIDDSALLVEVPVDEVDAEKLHLGQRVELSRDTAGSASITGAVTHIPLAVGRSGTVENGARRDRSLYVEVTPNAQQGLRIGSALTAEFLVREKAEVLFVPTRAVVGRGIERWVYRVRDGRLERAAFRAGITSWERTEVLSGLNEGDRVVTRLGDPGLEEGARIEVVERGEG